MSFGTDYSVYINNGFLIKNGKIPYRDFFHHKLPLFDYYLGLMQYFFGTSWLSLKMVLIFTYILSTTAFYFFSYKILKSFKWTVLSSILFLFYITRLDLDSNRNGSIIVFGMIFIFISLALLFMGIFNKDNYVKKNVYFFNSGIFNSFAILSRQVSIEPILLISLIFVISIFSESWKTRINKKNYFFFLLGFLLTSFIAFTLILYFASYEKFYTNVIQYNIEYLKYFTNWMTLAENSFYFFKKTSIFWIVLIAFIYLNISEEEATKSYGKILIKIFSCSKYNFAAYILLISIVIVVVSRGRQYYYFFEVIPFLIIMSLLVLSDYIKELKTKYKLNNNKIIISPLIVIFMFGAFYSIEGEIFINTYAESIKYFKQISYNIKNYPEQILATKAKQLFEDLPLSGRKMFVAGSRTVIYCLSESFSPYYSFIPNSIYGMSVNPFVILQEIKKYDPYIIIDWDYKYFSESNQLTNYINKNYVKIFESSRKYNYPYPALDNAILYKKKSNLTSE